MKSAVSQTTQQMAIVWGLWHNYFSKRKKKHFIVVLKPIYLFPCPKLHYETLYEYSTINTALESISCNKEKQTVFLSSTDTKRQHWTAEECASVATSI